MMIEVHKEKCSGCRLCKQICAIYHFNEINPRKSAIAIHAEFPIPGVFTPLLCNQCGKCAQVCPVGAITKEGDAYKISQDLCTLCMECVEVCPDKVMFIHKEVGIPIKCDLCMKCTEVCNTGALIRKE